MTPSKEVSKKRLFPHSEEEISAAEQMEELFKIPTDDRFNSMMIGKHNDKEKAPISLKRAPLNHEIIEELE
jgi:hypothetical protein